MLAPAMPSVLAISLPPSLGHVERAPEKGDPKAAYRPSANLELLIVLRYLDVPDANPYPFQY